MNHSPIVIHCSRFLILLILTIAGLTAAPQAMAQSHDLSGSWSGHWQSCSSGHQGPMNATFCKIDDAHYRVDFRGRFFKVFPFRYSVTLNVVSQTEDAVELAGSSYLGRVFGTFHYRATVRDNCFTASYSSCKDCGKFVMQKCGCCVR